MENKKKISLVLTDCDGVLTNGLVHYDEQGGISRSFFIRDGMGFRLLRYFGVKTGVISGEDSPAIKIRALKLKVEEIHLGIKDKREKVIEIAERLNIPLKEIAYIGDDINDFPVLQMVGIFACPSDAAAFIKQNAGYICKSSGGNGVFREFAEHVLELNMEEITTKLLLNKDWLYT